MDLPIDRFVELPAFGAPHTRELPVRELKGYMGQPVVLHLFTQWGGCWPCSAQLEKWASSPRFKGAHFLAVGCAGPQMAMTMRDRNRMRNATVAFVEQRDMPTWGQLGCNGFIVFDSELSVVTRATSALNQLGELSFKHTEHLLDCLLSKPSKPIPAISPGQMVKFRDLVAGKKLNGSLGVVLQPLNEAGRLQVLVMGAGGAGNQAVSVKEANVRLATEEEGDEGCSEGAWPPAEGGGSGCGDCSSGGCSSEGCSSSSCAASASPPPGKSQQQQQQQQQTCKDGKCGGCGDADSSSEDSSEGWVDDDEEEGDSHAAKVDLSPLPSVRVADMDKEHETCVERLRELSEKRSYAALEALVGAFEAHFEHEEQLLDTHLYHTQTQSQATSGFSVDANMRKTHYADHARQLRWLQSELKRLEPDQSVPARVVSQACGDFRRHAELYDSYGDKLLAAMQKA